MTEISLFILFLIILLLLFTVIGLLLLYHMFKGTESEKDISYYANILEFSPFPAVIFRISDLVILTINNRSSDLFRISRDKAPSKNIQDFFVDQKDIVKIIQTVRMDEKVIDYETKLIPRGGRFFWALISANLISVSGEDAVVFAFADINHQKELEITIQKNKELYRSIIRTSPDNITMVDPKLFHP